MDLIATALPALEQALSLVLHPQQIFYLIVGILLGLSVGILPGLGGIAGLSLVLPFLFGMEPVSGLAMMIGLIAVIPTSDTFSSVLLGIPGSTASQATVLDGFPMAKNGEAARALAAAFMSSLFGGIVGAFALTFFILIARPLILAFTVPAMLMVIILGLSMVAILAGRVPVKGIIAAGLGLLIGTIGTAGAGGSLRIASYDYPYLVDGVQLVIVGLGIYAIPEIVSLLRQDQSISRTGGLGKGWLDGLRDWWRNKWLSFRSALLGVFVGIVPGLGGSVVDWIAYGFTVQTAKDKSRFGQGDVRGVIGPESSNNAKEGGGLVPTLIFGIPGSGSMAVFIGGLALLGFEAGPHMVRNNLDLTYTIVWSLALANVIGAGLCILLSGQIARITTIRFTLIAPYLFMIITFAAFQSSQRLGDLIALIAIGFLGIFLRRFDYSRPAFLIGYVLSYRTENLLNQVYQIAGSRFRRGFEMGMDYIATPLTLSLLALTIVSIIIGVRQAKNIRESADLYTGSKTAPMAFLLLIMAYAAYAVYDASGIMRTGDRMFPMIVGSITVVAGAFLLLRMIRRPVTDPAFMDLEAGGEDGNAPVGLWSALSWLIGLVVLSIAFGFVIAASVFLLIFFRIAAGLGWLRSAVMASAGVGFIVFLAFSLGRVFPPGLLQDYVRLPWPLG